MIALTIFLGVWLALSIIILFVTLSSFIGFVKTKVPQIPTAARDIERLVEEGLLRKEDLVVDLGCGNGKVLFLMEKLAGCRGRGYELALWACVYGWIKRRLTSSRVEIVWGNFFKGNLKDATVVYCYLYPFLMPKVGAKIKQDCKPGTTIIARDFPIPSLNQKRKFHTYANHEFFIYTV
jgi:hypothetical protein